MGAYEGDGKLSLGEKLQGGGAAVVGEEGGYVGSFWQCPQIYGRNGSGEMHHFLA